jgi:hypothetical protein
LFERVPHFRSRLYAGIAPEPIYLLAALHAKSFMHAGAEGAVHIRTAALSLFKQRREPWQFEALAD